MLQTTTDNSMQKCPVISKKNCSFRQVIASHPALLVGEWRIILLFVSVFFKLFLTEFYENARLTESKNTENFVKKY